MSEIRELTEDGRAGRSPVTLGGRVPMAWRPVAVVTAIAVVVHAAVLTRYGWFGDEFYYVICGRHPAWGYADQPPLTPFLARPAAAIPLDNGLVGLRVLAVAFQAGCILLTAVLTAELGGRRRAQLIAAGAIAAAPVFVGAALLFGTTVTDQFFWVAVLVLVARALRIGSTRAWLLAGLAAGLGLENKSTVAVLLLGIGVGLALFRRPVLRTRGPWLAGLLAVLIEVPNLVWDARHRWINLSMTRSLSHKSGGPLGSLLVQLPELVIAGAGLLLIALWILGIRLLNSAEQRAHRWILSVAVVAVVLFTVSGGKAYYPAPALTGLFAAGAVRVERSDSPRGRRAWPVLIAITTIMSVLTLLPVLPPQAADKIRSLNPDVMDTYGWPRFVTEVAQATKSLPPGVPIFTSDYEEAGALTILGPADGVHRPIASGHNNYWIWGPPPGSDATVFTTGVSLADLDRICGKVTEVGQYTLPDGLRNDELDRGITFDLCQDPRGTWAQLWPGLEHLD
jgi:Dolichyl-phosphate-mannose-protein mannosyltransferase